MVTKTECDRALKNRALLAIIQLIDQGMDVNYCDDRGVSPLMIAVQEPYADAVSHFLSLGANVNQQDGDGNTALHYLLFDIHRQQVQTVDEIGAINIFRKVRYSRDKVLMIVKEILLRDPDLTLVNSHGMTAIDAFSEKTNFNSKLKSEVIEVLERYIENQALEAVIESNDVSAGVLF